MHGCSFGMKANIMKDGVVMVDDNVLFYSYNAPDINSKPYKCLKTLQLMEAINTRVHPPVKRLPSDHGHETRP